MYFFMPQYFFVLFLFSFLNRLSRLIKLLFYLRNGNDSPRDYFRILITVFCVKRVWRGRATSKIAFKIILLTFSRCAITLNKLLVGSSGDKRTLILKYKIIVFL